MCVCVFGFFQQENFSALRVNEYKLPIGNILALGLTTKTPILNAIYLFSTISWPANYNFVF